MRLNVLPIILAAAVALALLLAACGGEPESPEDRAALVALYNATDGDNWTDNTNWLSGRPLYEWHGIATDDNGRVVYLSLPNNQLSGEIPPELGNLANLEWLELYENQLSGEIPPELGNLVNLRELRLYDNQLSGEIPAELGNLSSLEHLDLYDNQLSGEIPAELGNLSSLEHLDLSDNELREIPPELGNLTNLYALYLAGNELREIPPELGNLTNLAALGLYSNQLSEIPPWLGDLTNLSALYLYDNQLSGEIPPELGNLVNLRELRLYDNPLSGCVPAVLQEQLSGSGYYGIPPFCGVASHTPTLTPAPTVEPTAPLAERVAAYAQACNAAEVSVSDTLAVVSVDAEDEDLTWGELAEAMDILVDAYGQLVPPQELRAYHNAELQVREAIRDHAGTRPGDDSFATEFILVFVEIFEAGLELAFDETKTEEEKERLIEEFANEKLGELFGPDFITAYLALEEAADGLSEETLELLQVSGCEFFGDVFGEVEFTAEPEESSADDRVVDDHGDDFDSATTISVGVAVDGVVEHGNDRDFFRFAVEQGHFYQVDTTLETEPVWLEAHVPDVDSPGELVWADLQYGWEASVSGEAYFEVSGGGWTGSYTLTVNDLVDDHSNTIVGATAVSVGESVEGVIDRRGDLDYFRFTAEAGETYHFDVALGTLPDWNVEVLNSEGDVLETRLWNRHEGGSFTAWEAEESGEYYVAVRGGFLGWEVGTYTLTVTLDQ